jgi:hypothetical protein
MHLYGSFVFFQYLIPQPRSCPNVRPDPGLLDAAEPAIDREAFKVLQAINSAK